MFQRFFLFIIVCVLPLTVFTLESNYECLYQNEDLEGAMIHLGRAVTLTDLTDVYLGLETLHAAAANYNEVCNNFSFSLEASNFCESAETCQSVFEMVKSGVDEYYADGELEKSSQRLIDLVPRFQMSCSQNFDLSDE